MAKNAAESFICTYPGGKTITKGELSILRNFKNMMKSKDMRKYE
jgi:hypothetical protein